MSAAAVALAFGMLITEGGRIDLYRDPSICVGEARRAVYVPREGGSVPGCWLLAGGRVQVVFLNGFVTSAEPAEVREPARL